MNEIVTPEHITAAMSLALNKARECAESTDDVGCTEALEVLNGQFETARGAGYLVLISPCTLSSRGKIRMALGRKY